MQLVELYDVTFSHFDQSFYWHSRTQQHNSCRTVKLFFPMKSLSAHSTLFFVKALYYVKVSTKKVVLALSQWSHYKMA
jgi:hypothetical protein